MTQPRFPPGEAAKWLATLVADCVSPPLTREQEEQIAEMFQFRMKTGYIVGKMVTGDHEDEKGNTVYDWTEFGE